MAENRDLKALPLAQLKAVMAELGEKPSGRRSFTTGCM